MSKPPIAYYGGKTSIAEKVAAALPDHRHYIEPFCGSLAVLLAKPRSPFETVNDLDGQIMTFWRVLRDRGDELAYRCALTPHSRAEHAASFDLDVDDELELARRIWVRLSQGRAGMLRKTGWRFYANAARRTSSMPATLNAYVERMWEATERLAGVSLECRPALDIITQYGNTPTVCLYVDPPYLGTTRGWGNQYQHEMRDEDAHRLLAAELAKCSASVVLSGYPSTLYDDLYDGWDRIEHTVMVGRGGAGGRSAERTEVLWSNRPITQPHLFSEDTA